MRRLRWFLALPALLIATSGPSIAAEIRDKANMFSTEAVKKAEAELIRIEKEYSVPVTIETTETINDKSIDEVLPKHAQAADARGLYVLMVKNDHKIEAEAYKTYTKFLTRQRCLAIRDAFSREFKQKEFDTGLGKGIDKIDSVLSEARAEAGGTLRPSAPAGRRNAQVPAPVGRAIPGKPSSGGMGMLLSIGLGILALFIVIRILGSLFGGGNRGYAGQNRMMGPGGAPGGPGYGPGYGGGGGGGGFMSSMFGGIGGALAGNWLYDQFSGRHHDTSVGQSNYDPSSTASAPEEAGGPDWVGPGDGGGDWGGGGDTGGGGGDWGGGGGAGGGDWGGGGGGDWGGGGGGDDGGSW